MFSEAGKARCEVKKGILTGRKAADTKNQRPFPVLCAIGKLPVAFFHITQNPF